MWRRIAIVLPIKLMDSEGNEIETHTLDVGGGGLRLPPSQKLRLNERVIVYSSDLGRLETEVVRADPHGVGLKLIASPHKREKIVDQLTFLMNRERYEIGEVRRAERAPGTGSIVAELEDGTQFRCLVIDMSLVGIALATDGMRPALAARVKIGPYWGRCARYLPNGFALDFTRS
jgi:hypothetical protein